MNISNQLYVIISGLLFSTGDVKGHCFSSKISTFLLRFQDALRKACFTIFPSNYYYKVGIRSVLWHSGC